MAVDPVDASKLSDRELLLILHERVGTLSRDVHELRDGTAQKIAQLESRVEMLQEHKADKAAVDGAMDRIAAANEVRTKQINTINTRIAFAAGSLAALQFITGIIIVLVVRFAH
jgi:hypothetical protein